MGDIFSNAHGVMVWVGADEDVMAGPGRTRSLGLRTSSKAFVAVCSLVSAWAADTKRNAMHERPRWQYRPRGSTEPHGPGQQIEEQPKTAWVDILPLFERRWFHCLWVVQEIALAQRATPYRYVG